MMSKYNVQNGSDEIEQRIKKIEWDNSKTKSKPEIHTIFLGEEMVGQIINKLKELHSSSLIIPLFLYTKKD